MMENGTLRASFACCITDTLPSLQFDDCDKEDRKPYGYLNFTTVGTKQFFIFQRAEEVYPEFLKTKTGTVAGSENWSGGEYHVYIYIHMYAY